METRYQTKQQTKRKFETEKAKLKHSTNYLNSSTSSSSKFMPLDYTLHQVFLEFPNHLNVVHINVQSIPCHHLQLLSTFERAHNIDAILLSETFLKSTMPTESFFLPGFKLIRNDREDKSCGGVAIYLRNDIHFKIYSCSPKKYSKSAEHLFVEISLDGIKVILGVYYNPPYNKKYLPSFEDLLKNLRKKYDDILILGDFNTCLLKKNKYSKNLQLVLEKYNMHLPSLGPTHFAPKTVPSLLDLIIVSDLSKVLKHGQLTGLFSYHDILFASYKIPSPKNNLFCNLNLEIEPPDNLKPVTKSIPFWRTVEVRQALTKQLNAKRTLKRKRTDSSFEETQECRKVVKKLEKKHCQAFPQTFKIQRTIRKTYCSICESRSKKRG